MARNLWTNGVGLFKRVLVRGGLACVALTCCACGDDKNDNSNPNSEPVPVSVRAGQRLTWDQRADNLQQLRALTFNFYVDGSRSSLSNTSCSDQAAAGQYVCSGVLPSMPPGRHTLELTSVLNGVESSRSSLVVSISSTSAIVNPSDGSSALQPEGASRVCVDGADGACYEARVVASGLESATTLVAGRDGRIFFVEGEKQIRVIIDGALAPEPALSIADRARIVGLAVEDGENRTPYVYVAWSDRTRDNRAALNVSRYRELQNLLGEAAQIVAGLPFKEGAFAPLAVGDDGLLYIALPAPAESSPGGTGLILRVTRDGFTPPNSTQASPAYVRGRAWPTSLMAGASGTLWSAGRSEAESREVAVIGETSAATAFVSLLLPSSSTTRREELAIPDPALSGAPATHVFMATNGRLLRGVSSGKGGLRFDEVRFDDRLIVIGVVQSPNGSIYVSLSRGATQPASVLLLRQAH